MILVDTLMTYPPTGLSAGDRWCHMVSDTSFEELHEMARRIGLKREWFQGDHYDLTPGRRERALRAGAVAVTVKELAMRRFGAGGDRIRALLARGCKGAGR